MRKDGETFDFDFDELLVPAPGKKD